LGKGGLACAAPFPKSCAQIWAQDSGCSFYNRSNQQNFKNEKFIVDYHMPPRHTARLSNSARFARPPKSIVNLKNLHKCLIYADFTLLGYRHAGDAVCLPYLLRPRREFLALSFGFLTAALPLIRGEFRTLPFPPLAATCRCIHL